MPRRRYVQLDRLAKRLGRRLSRLVVYVRARRGDESAKQYALMRARAILEDHFLQVLDYTFRSHVKRDLHKRKGVKNLGYGDTQDLRREIERKLEEFKAILNDV